MKLLLRLVAVCACVALGFGLSRASHRWRDPLDPAPGRAVLRTMNSGAPAVEPGRTLGGLVLEKMTPDMHAGLLRSARREIYLEELQDMGSPIRKTAWFAKINGGKGFSAAVDELVRATRIDVEPRMDVVVVNVSISPPAEASVVANAFCERYFDERRDEQYSRVVKMIELFDKQDSVSNLTLFPTRSPICGSSSSIVPGPTSSLP